MSKRDNELRINRSSPVIGGEMVAVASVTQVQHLTISGPYSGDFQIIDNGRLIVGNDPEIGARIIVSSKGLFGYSAGSTNTMSLWTSTSPNGDNTPGDFHLGNLAANFFLHDQSEGTIGLYTAAGAAFKADNDGSLTAGNTDGAHMKWDSASESWKILAGVTSEGEIIVAEIDALGNASFTGVMTATGGRITGDMQVDAMLRAGDVDGPAVYVGKLVDEEGTAYAGLIQVTDTENVPWFVVRTGDDGTGHLQIGRPGDFPNRLTLDVTETGSTLVYDGVAYLRGGIIAGDMTVEGDLTVTGGSITAGGGDVVIGDDGIRLDASTGRFTSASVEWFDGSVRKLSIGTQVDLGSVTAGYVEAVGVSLNLTGDGVSIDPGGTNFVTVAGDVLVIANDKTPASAGATGTAGMIAWDTSYLYVCTATNTWKRIALAW